MATAAFNCSSAHQLHTRLFMAAPPLPLQVVPTGSSAHPPCILTKIPNWNVSIWNSMHGLSSLISLLTGRSVHPLHLAILFLNPRQNAEKRFPSLFCLAMDVLPAQVSSVPCERLFSPAKETFTAHRNKDLMEALQALNIEVFLSQ